jgi:hypothetical protein
MPFKLKVGDILEADANDHVIRIQYIGHMERTGDVIYVEPKLLEAGSEVGPLSKNGYFTLYPASKALNVRLMRRVGNETAPEMPTTWRMGGLPKPDKSRRWKIVGPTESRWTDELTEEEYRIPVVGVWNHEFLLERVRSGWKPEDEAKRIVHRRADAGSETVQRLPVRHFLYFPTNESAVKVIAELRNSFYTYQLQAPDEKEQCLLLVSHTVRQATTDMIEAEERLDELARNHGGRYDGNEVQVRPG